MIGDLKPYRDYKETGLPWLGNVPAHWRIARNGSLFGQRVETGHAELPILEVSLRTGVKVRAFGIGGRKQVMSDLSKYKRAARGDLAYNTMRMWQGALGVCPVDGLVSPAYVVARAYAGVEPRYFAALFRTADYMAEIDGASRGIVKDRNRLYWEQFKQMRSPCPPPEEQAAIVRILDWANGRLERTIRAKRKVIALLNEQKQATIHRAVTFGLDPSVPLRPSGISWLGEIPQHWRVWRLKFVADRIVDCLHATPRYIDSGTHPAIRTADITPGEVDVKNAKKISAREYSKWTARLRPQEGDVLYSREGERFGIAACVPPGTELCISQRMMAFRIGAEQRSTFVMWVLNGQSTYEQALQDVMGSTAPHVNISTIKNYFLALPGKAEQGAIVEHIGDATHPIDLTMNRLRCEIDLLREYRTRLIADIVTGKLDVREAATRLPDLAPVDATQHNANLTADSEPADEEAIS